MSFSEELLAKVKEYCESMPDLKGADIPILLIDFVIEKFKQRRNYPSSFSDEKIEADMKKYLSTMAMAVIDLYCKTGFEGQTSSNENGVSRTWESAYISSSLFRTVMPYVRAMSFK